MDLLAYLKTKACKIEPEGTDLYKVEPAVCCNHSGCAKVKRKNGETFYKCFSCGCYASNSVALEAQLSNIPYNEAKAKLEGGSVIPFTDPLRSLIEKNHAFLMKSPEHLNWLINIRKFSAIVIKRFLVGCYQDQEGRIIYTFPYFDGLIIRNIKSRTADKSVLFQRKDAGFYIFNANVLKNASEVLIVEGEMDVLAAYSYGVSLPAISFGLGANNIKEEWLDSFSDIKTIYISYDADDAGKKGGRRLAEFLGIDRCRFVFLPFKDLNDALIAGYPKEKVEEAIKRSLSLDQLDIMAGISAIPEDESIIGEKVASLLEQIARRPVTETEDYLRAVREHLPVTYKQKLDFRHTIDVLRRNLQSNSESDEHVSAYVMTDDEQRAAKDFLLQSNIVDTIADSFNVLGLVGERENAVVTFLCSLTRLMDEQSHVLITGQSSSGKSMIADIVTSVVPEEDVVAISSASAHALNYIEEEKLQRKLCVISEFDGALDMLYTLRVAQSEGKLNRLYVGKNEATGEMKTFDSAKSVRVSFLITSNLSPDEIDSQNISRLMVLFSNESVTQTELVRDAILRRQIREWKASSSKRDAIKLLLKNAQRLLQPVEVDIPFSPYLRFPARCARNRRDLNRFLSVIKAIAFLRQHQKEIHDRDDKPFIEADLTDYSIAHRYLRNIIANGLNELSQRATTVLRVCCCLRQEKQGEETTSFSYGEILKAAQILGVDVGSRENVRRRVCELIESEHLGIADGGHLGQKGKQLHFEVIVPFTLDKNCEIKEIQPASLEISDPEEIARLWQPKIKETQATTTYTKELCNSASAKNTAIEGDLI